MHVSFAARFRKKKKKIKNIEDSEKYKTINISF